MIRQGVMHLKVRGSRLIRKSGQTQSLWVRLVDYLAAIAKQEKAQLSVKLSSASALHPQQILSHGVNL